MNMVYICALLSASPSPAVAICSTVAGRHDPFPQLNPGGQYLLPHRHDAVTSTLPS